MEWSFIAAAVQRRLRLVLVCAVIGAIPGLLSIARATDTFEASATIGVSAPNNTSQAAAYQPDRYVVSQIPVVTSMDTLEKAAEALGGDWSAGGIASMITVEQEPDTDIIRVKATGGSAEAVALVANAVADTYVSDSSTRMAEAREPEIAELDERLETLSGQITTVNETISEAMAIHLTLAREGNYIIPSEQVIVPNEVQQRDSLLAEYGRVLSAKTDIQLGITNQTPSTVIESATTPSVPKGSMARFILIGGVIFGALAGTAVVLVLAQLSSKVLDEQVAEDILGVTIVGTLPRNRHFAESPIEALTSSPIETRETIERLSVRAEAMADPEIDHALSIAVLGTQPAAGTTTLTLALARRLARSGYSVVVIDGDLRTQTISELVGAPPKSGISAVLRAVSRPNARKDKVVTETEHPNVTVMGATGIDKGATLRRDALVPILDAARDNGQIVLYDGGAVTGSALNIFAARTSDVVVLAVPLVDQSQAALREVADLLPDDRSRVLAVITSPARRRTRVQSLAAAGTRSNTRGGARNSGGDESSDRSSEPDTVAAE